MRKSVALLSNLLLSSTLFWAVPAVEGQEMISRVPTDTTAYCHAKFPTMREDTLPMDPPILDPLADDVVDFNGPCDHDQPAWMRSEYSGASSFAATLTMEIER